MNRIRRQLLLAACSALVAAPAAASEPRYPDRPVTILVASAAGGPLDTVARYVGRYLGETWGVPVVVDQRPGAGGTIAASALARSPADGYTLMLATRAVTINPSLYRSLNFDTARDLAPVATVNEQPQILVVPPDFPAHTVPEFVALLRDHPGKYFFGSPGMGGIPHLAGEMFLKASGTQMTHVPYKGFAPLATDLLAKRIDLTFASPPSVMQQIKDGQLRAIAITSAQRSPLLPDLPTFAEAGLPDVNITSWYGLFAPGGTPPAIVRKINADVQAFLARPETAAWIAEQGAQPAPISVDAFEAAFQQDLTNFAALLQGIGVTPH